MPKLKVFFTVDTEVWPGGWDNLDARFPEAFRHYVYGDTPQGQYALPMTLKLLNDHGLKGVFFVEPLFSARFGLQPLQEILGLIQEAGQEVQMHLHPEWADEALEPVLPSPATEKRQHLKYYSRAEQISLIRWGKARLEQAIGTAITAFRTGSFAFNLDTLTALQANGIALDSSYNHCSMGPESGLLTRLPEGTIPNHPLAIDGMVEYPVTVYQDRPGHLRPLQLTACSLGEITTVLDRAADAGYPSVMIVSHNFEMLDRRDFSRDSIVVRRFEGLCRFLARNTDRFETVGFNHVTTSSTTCALPPVQGNWSGLAVRLAEQAARRL